MKIAVTEIDISEGRQDCSICPIERAFHRYGLQTMVSETDVAFFANRTCLVVLPLPPAAIEFIKAFDHPRRPALPPPQPFEFHLDISAELLEAAGS